MLKMIIVEDERLEREGLLDFLEWDKFGIQIVGTACDGIDGLELAKKVKPDIIITDIKMPGINGLEMSTKVKEILPNAEIIILTGYDDFTFAKKAIGFRAFDYILKPVEEEEMIDVVKKVVKKGEEENKIKVMIKDSFGTVKSKLLLDLFQGKTNDETIFNHLEEYGIRFNGNENLIVSIIRIVKFNSSEAADRNVLLKSISEELKNYYIDNKIKINLESSLLFIDDFKNEIIICASVIEKLSDSVQQFLVKVSDLMTKKYNLILLIGTGRYVSDIHDISISYNCAREALEYGEFWSISGIVFYDKIANMQEIINCKMPDLIIKGNEVSKNIIYAISINDQNKLFELLTKLFTYIAENKSLDKEIIGNYLYNIVNEAAILICNMNKLNDEFMKYYSSSGRRLKSLRTYKDMENYLYSFFQKIFEFLNEKRNNRDESIVKKVIELIENKYKGDINLKVIASEVYLSPNYLGNLFSKFTGKTFNDYLCEYRMELAKKLLQETSKKVSTIAKEVGIPNTSYFCILFKNKFGVAPGEFQHMMLNK